MRRTASISARLTLLFAAVATSILLVLGLLVGNEVERHFVEQDMEVLDGKNHLIGHLLEQYRSPADLPMLVRQLGDSLVGHHGLAAVLIDGAGRRVFATPGAAFPEAMLLGDGADGRPRTWMQDGLPWRGVASRLPTAGGQPAEMRVALAVDISHHERFMASFRRTLWLFVAFAALLAGVLGWVVVRRGLAPLQAMRRDAAAVTADRLDLRLALDDVPAELAELAATLNEMLARLEDSFGRLRDFSSDLAHELRTPVSNLMTETQVALSRARSPEEYREILGSNAEEFERMARMIGDMLFLAQADHGLLVPTREPVDLAAQVRELFDFFDALAEEKGLRLALEGGGSVTGDTLMLRRALANLIANAIRHSVRDSRVEVRIGAAGGGTLLAIENRGEPVPAQHLSRIFDRFHRVDPSRSRDDEGAGLGLAITRSIVRAHGGEITARALPDGMRFEILLA